MAEHIQLPRTDALTLQDKLKRYDEFLFILVQNYNNLVDTVSELEYRIKQSEER